MLERKISVVSGVAIAVCMVVGSGLFGLPGLVIKATDPVTALAGWALVIAMMPVLIHVFCCLGQRHPSTEGISLYATLGLGQWSRKGVMLVMCGTLVVGMPAFFLVGGTYLAKSLGLATPGWNITCAIVLAVLTTSINLAGIDKLSWINRAVVALVLLTVGIVCLYSLPMASEQYSSTKLLSELHHLEWGNVWIAASIVFWAFQGWENLTFGFGEVKNPVRNIPLIFWLSFLLVALTYGVFSAVMSAAALKGMDVAGLAGAASLLPPNLAGKAILALMVLVLIANANSWVFGCSRAFYSASRAGVLPRRLSSTTAHGTPAKSLLFALAAYVAVILGMWLFDISEQFFFLLTTQGFILLYGAAILAFIRFCGGALNRLVAVLAVACWGFLMHGFGWMVLYPLILLAIGTALDVTAGQKTIAEGY